MESLSPLSSSPVQQYPQGARKTDTGEAQPPAGDSVSLGAAQDLQAKVIRDLLAGSGPTTTANLFFGEKGTRVSFNTIAAGNGPDFPQGGWRVDNLDAAANPTQPRAWHLDDSRPSDYAVSTDLPCNRPFGRWKKTDEGWIGESTWLSDDQASTIERAMVSTFLGKNGEIEMVLTEVLRGGGGIVSQLDAEAYRQNPGDTPPVKARHTFTPDELVPAPPFPCHTSIRSPGKPLSVDQFFQPRAGDFTAEFKKPSLHTLQPAWEVKLNNPFGMTDLTAVLGKGEAVGTKKEVHDPWGGSEFRMEWERVGDGWVNRRKGKINPEGLTALSSSVFETKLKDDQTVTLTLTEIYRNGGGCEFALKGDEDLKNPTICPPVLSARPFKREDLVKSALGIAGAPAESAPDNEMTSEDGWLVIGDTRIRVKE